ncbi:MAG: type II 3-dehydroquinate dehydratase [Ignavibacterium sp.]|jgi:3-dehydroquinate dehydratase-2
MNILILNGPNLGMLGQREPEVYGSETLADLEARLRKRFPDVQFTFFQSNHEGVLVDELNKAAGGGIDGVVINPGAYAHSSYAIRDAVAALKIPVVEVHITNVHAREEFRRRSLIAPVCRGVVTGLGRRGYELAVQFLVDERA